MKRRNFIKAIAIGAAIYITGGIAKLAAQTIVWAREGVLGYKKKAPLISEKANKKCDTCRWYSSVSDPKEAGLCSLKGMQNAMKSDKVHVHNIAICNMYSKKS